MKVNYDYYQAMYVSELKNKICFGTRERIKKVMQLIKADASFSRVVQPAKVNHNTVT